MRFKRIFQQSSLQTRTIEDSSFARPCRIGRVGMNIKERFLPQQPSVTYVFSVVEKVMTRSIQSCQNTHAVSA